jgi:hypothetical protein
LDAVREGWTRGDTGRTPFGINVGIGAVVVVAASMAAAVFPAVGVRLAVVAVSVAGYAAVVCDVGAAFAVAGLGYLLFNGFLVNRLGELTWDGTASLWHASALLLAILLGTGVRWVRAVRADLLLAEEVAGLTTADDGRAVGRGEGQPDTDPSAARA